MDQKSLPTRLALLIDAENVGVDHLPQMLDAANQLGAAVVRRIYCDFANPAMAPWKGAMQAYPLEPRQTISWSGRKNAADFALTVDALDLYHRGLIDAVLLASSDADFADLIAYLKSANVAVFGLGRANVSNRHRTAFDKYFELTPVTGKLEPANISESVSLRAANLDWDAVLSVITTMKGGEGWLSVAAAGGLLGKSGLQSKSFGHKTWTKVFRNSLLFECIDDPRGQPQVRVRSAAQRA